ncbi:ABC transporter ATP-binding protein [Rhizobium sp. MHM7A]|uniref:ABC transporter ATP-binding protein n=1 Tax=Rhizobium sp. MHM7A TaxID=2583233 RepID=UPI0014865A53|nr:ABC transporter ATP-binding protein [Rhizobium sp. MHM7A]
MLSDTAVSVRSLFKTYKLLNNPTAQLCNLVGLNNPRFVPRKEVLKGISFDVRQGENVGILGINGAGKSTLLNMIAGMSKPTAGEIVTNGTIGAILELGAGFHHELSGRQNAETALMLQGIDRGKIPELVERIVEFSELGADLDSKTRTYSSGMLVRLAFATACVVNPDIFIVDEALAVGDARFQQKCYDFLLNDMSESTLILISHDMAAITAICDRVIILNGGHVVFDGHPAQGVLVYNKIIQSSSSMSAHGDIDLRKTGPRDIDIASVSMLVAGAEGNMLRDGDKIEITCNLDNKLDATNLIAAFKVTDVRGQAVFGQSALVGGGRIVPSGKSTFALSFDWPMLAPGQYCISLGIGKGRHTSISKNQCWIQNAFEVTAVMNQPAHGFFNVPMVVA